jgi:glycine betaine/proline transport system permease protein
MATQVQSLPLTLPVWKRALPWLVVLAVLVAAPMAVGALKVDIYTFPTEWNLGLRKPIDDWQSSIIANRESLAMFQYFFDPLSAFIDTGLRWAEDFLLATPWIGLIAIFVLLGYLLSGLRLAVLCGIGLLVMGLFGLWEPSLQTLALMIVSVVLSVLIGLPLGILTASSDRFDKFLRPILDGMQTMPTFVYLIPVVLFFGIARVPAVIATLIYAVPPMIRLTNLGIRQVSPPAIEAARAFGSTRLQLLFKVQLPLALPVVMTGVNQTIMMALSMVVIAALIGAGGLGRQVLVSLQRLEVGKALEAGLAIVLLAIVLDRLSEGLSQIDLSADAPRRLALPKWVPARWETRIAAAVNILQRIAAVPADFLASITRRASLSRYAGLINAALLIATLFVVDQFVHFGAFPEGWRWYLRQPTDTLVKWMRDNLFEIPLGGLTIGTGPVSDFVTLFMLNPLRDFFTTALPWPVMVLGVAALGYWAGQWRLALFSGVGMLAVGLLGMWGFGMDTLSQILVTTLFTVAIAVPVGVLASQSDAVRDFLRPILDFLQTIPSFVFLVPVIMLFNIGRVPGIIAAVLYAIAPGIKLTDLGIRQVSGEAIEAARAFGSTRAQMLVKVQVPMALPSISLGVNQMIMMVLAMVIISGMVGGAGLGLEAVNGLARGETGRGLEAGIAIVLIAVIMDRITQAWANKQLAESSRP